MFGERVLVQLKNLTLNAGADARSVEQVLETIGGTLPAGYLDLVKYANGGEGFVAGHGFIQFWPIEEIPPVCAANEFERSAPGLLPFASGGGNVFAFDRRSFPMKIVEIPLIGISWKDAKVRADSVEELLAYLAVLRHEA